MYILISSEASPTARQFGHAMQIKSLFLSLEIDSLYGL